MIKSQVGLNSYKLSAKEWVEKTGAIGIFANLPASERLKQLNNVAITQMRSLVGLGAMKRIGSAKGGA